MRSLVIIAMLVSMAACGGGSAPDGGQTRFLLLAHVPLAGQLSTASDATLIELGRRACIEMDARTSSDQIVADIGHDPEPGSAAFNAYSYMVVAAASELCPGHKEEFSGGLPPG